MNNTGLMAAFFIVGLTVLAIWTANSGGSLFRTDDVAPVFSVSSADYDQRVFQ